MKKSHILTGFAAMGVMTAFSSAQAIGDEDRWPRWYIGLGGGYTMMTDQDVSGGGVNKLSANDGFGLSGAIGYLPSSSMPLLNALRFEAEVTYHQNNIHSVQLNNGATVSGSGSYDSTAYMANVFYDFERGGNWTPYIGGGAGIATLHLPTGSGLGNGTSSNDQFAYQGLVGIGYSPDTIPNTQWTLGYRYLATTQANFGGTNVDYSVHNIEAGVKLRF